MKNVVIRWIVAALIFVGGGAVLGVAIEVAQKGHLSWDGYPKGGCVQVLGRQFRSNSTCKFGYNKSDDTWLQRVLWDGQGSWEVIDQSAMADSHAAYKTERKIETAGLGAVGGVALLIALLVLYVLYVTMRSAGAGASLYASTRKAELEARKAAAFKTLEREDPDTKRHRLDVHHHQNEQG